MSFIKAFGPDDLYSCFSLQHSKNETLPSPESRSIHDYLEQLLPRPPRTRPFAQHINSNSGVMRAHTLFPNVSQSCSGVRDHHLIESGFTL